MLSIAAAAATAAVVAHHHHHRQLADVTNCKFLFSFHFSLSLSLYPLSSTEQRTCMRIHRNEFYEKEISIRKHETFKRLKLNYFLISLFAFFAAVCCESVCVCAVVLAK
jgi:uncharacterized membrane protein